MTVAFKTTHGVFTALVTTPIVHTALVYVSTVGQSVQGVAFVAHTLETTRGVHTRVITCPLEITLIYILAGALISKQLEALATITQEAANGVLTEVFTATIVNLTLVNVFACLAVWLESEAHWTAAAHTCGCVLTGAVTPAVVHGTGLHKQPAFDSFVNLREGCGVVVRGLCGCFISFYTGPSVRVQGVSNVTPAYGPLLRVFTRVLAAPVTVVTGQGTSSLVPGQLKSWPALTGHAPFGSLLADVCAAMLLVHTAEALHRSLNTSVLVVTEEKSFFAATLVAAHGVDTCMLASSIVEHTFIDI